MKNKLFGQNIKPSCTYCENATTENHMTFCKKSKTIQNGKCRSFKYNPIMRKPKSQSTVAQYSAEDFKL